MSSRSFHIGDVLTLTTGRLVSPNHIGGLYELLGYMVGEPVATVQIPRVADECLPAVLAQHPYLTEIDPPDVHTEAEAAAWVAIQAARYGEYLPIEPLDPVDHTHIDHLDEMRMVAGDRQIIPVLLDGEVSS